jgi:hypothetical protein
MMGRAEVVRYMLDGSTVCPKCGPKKTERNQCLVFSCRLPMRYMKCTVCGATFKAIGDINAEEEARLVEQKRAELRSDLAGWKIIAARRVSAFAAAAEDAAYAMDKHRTAQAELTAFEANHPPP